MPDSTCQRDQVAQGSFVDGAVLLKRRDQRRTASTQLHTLKITLIGVCRETGSIGSRDAVGRVISCQPTDAFLFLDYNSRHTSLNSKKPFFAASHSAPRTAPSAKPRRDFASWHR